MTPVIQAALARHHQPRTAVIAREGGRSSSERQNVSPACRNLRLLIAEKLGMKPPQTALPARHGTWQNLTFSTT